jgi:hypothetical protein
VCDFLSGCAKEKKMMSVLQFLGIVMVAGGIGGLVNSLILDKGFALPRTVPKGDGTSLLLPGFIGNILTGAVGAGVSWSLYNTPQGADVSFATPSSLIALGGAVLVGMAGSGWLTNALEKNVFRAVASQAAATSPNSAVAQELVTATPANAARLVQHLDGLPVTQAASSRSDTRLRP